MFQQYFKAGGEVYGRHVTGRMSYTPIFLDDDLFFSQTFEEHISRLELEFIKLLEQVFQMLIF